ncbi:hypothetical protein [Streptomyces sp. NPDC088847]|uniref:hypothetical protein n=1 Tax=Streptomyces sp. NPDC088847 TaxID=3365909 RepID=UPI0038006F3F
MSNAGKWIRFVDAQIPLEALQLADGTFGGKVRLVITADTLSKLQGHLDNSQYDRVTIGGIIEV